LRFEVEEGSTLPDGFPGRCWPYLKETDLHVVVVIIKSVLCCRLAKTKQATAAGHAVAKGVATGMQAATAEIGTSLAQTVSSAAGGGKAADGTEKVPTAAAVAAASVGGVGMELLRVRPGLGSVK
jgi:hypothetical protein